MIAWIVLTLLLYFGNYPILTFFSFIFGIYYSVFFPFRQTSSYKKHYKNYISDLWQLRVEKVCYIELTKDYIFMSEDTIEFKISTSEVSKISEIRKYFFLYYKFGGTLILPKDSFMYNDLLEELLEIAQRNFIKIDNELNWSWGIRSILF